MLDKNNSHVDSATNTVTDLVNIMHEGNTLQDAMLRTRSCLVYPVDSFDNEVRGSPLTR